MKQQIFYQRATSHMSKGPRSCNSEGPWISSKGHTPDMVYWNLHQTYLLEVDLTQISTDYETLFTIYHVRIHVAYSSMVISLGP